MTVLHIPGRYEDAHLTIDFTLETACLDGRPMRLTRKSYALLAFLARHPGELVPRETLLRLVWGYGSEIRTRTLDVHIRRLRKSLGPYSMTYIETIFGVGYRFQPCRSVERPEIPKSSAFAAGAEVNPAWKMAGTAAC